MKTYTKVSDSEVEVTQTLVETIDVNILIQKRDELVKQRADFQAMVDMDLNRFNTSIAEIEAEIAEAQKVGVVIEEDKVIDSHFEEETIKEIIK